MTQKKTSDSLVEEPTVFPMPQNPKTGIRCLTVRFQQLYGPDYDEALTKMREAERPNDDWPIEAINEHEVRCCWTGGIKKDVSDDAAIEPVRRAVQTELGRPVSKKAFTAAEIRAEEAPVVDALGKLYGKEITGYPSNDAKVRADLDFNGVVIGDGDQIFLAADADKPAVTVVMHEMLHAMKRQHPDLYAALKTNLVPRLRDRTGYAKRVGIANRTSKKKWLPIYRAIMRLIHSFGQTWNARSPRVSSAGGFKSRRNDSSSTAWLA